MTTPTNVEGVKSKPILFSGPMVRAILDGSKTQTRRVIKFDEEPSGHPVCMDNESPHYFAWGADHYTCPYGQPGDHLWVRETFADICKAAYPHKIHYRADGENEAVASWQPSIFMPKMLSRITLEVTEVRVERLNGITPDDIRAEGAWSDAISMERADMPMDAWKELWDSINGKTHPWSSNPWVFVIAFKRIKP